MDYRDGSPAAVVVQLRLANTSTDPSDEFGWFVAPTDVEGLYPTCCSVSRRTITRLEVGYPARSVTDCRTLLTEPPIAAMPVEYLTPRIEDGAIELQLPLSERDNHRAPSIPACCSPRPPSSPV